MADSYAQLDSLLNSIAPKATEPKAEKSPDSYHKLDDLLDSVAPETKAPEAEPTTLGTYGETIGQAVKQVPGYLAQAYEGAEPYSQEPGTSNKLIENANKTQQEFESKPGGETPVLGGLATAKEVRQQAPSMASSAAGMVPTLAGSAAAGALAGSPLGPVGAGIGALGGAGLSYWGMKRAAENQTVRSLIDKENAHRQELGQTPLSLPEKKAIQDAANASGEVSKIGHAEAAPEEAGNLLELALLKSPAGKLLGSLTPKGAIARGLAAAAGKIAGTEGIEIGTEGVTQQLQHNPQVELGLSDEAKRSNLSPEDWAKSYGEVAKPVALATLPMAAVGGGVGGYQGYKSAKQEQQTVVPVDPVVQVTEDLSAQLNANLNPGVATRGAQAAVTAGITDPQKQAAGVAETAVAGTEGTNENATENVTQEQQTPQNDLDKVKNFIQDLESNYEVIKANPDQAKAYRQELTKWAKEFGANDKGASIAHILQGLKTKVADHETAMQTKGEENAINQRKAGASDVSSSAQPGVRQEGGNTAISGTGVPPSGQESGNIPEEKIENGESKNETKEERTLEEGQKELAPAAQAATQQPEVTEEQKDAKSYPKMGADFHGIHIATETPAGAERKGVDENGKPWSVVMQDNYGEIPNVQASDKDHLDVFFPANMTPEQEAATTHAYVVDQVNPETGAYDEAKVLLGYGSKGEAEQAYLRNYSSGWKGLGAITEMPMPEFKAWLKSGKTAQPVSPALRGIERRQNPELRANYDKYKTNQLRKGKRLAEYAAIKKQLYENPLSKIPNKLAFMEGPVTPYVASIDLDALKFINDNVGHAAGDELLKLAATVLQKHVDVYHVSGDEYWAKGQTEEWLKQGLEAALSEMQSGIHAVESEKAHFNLPSFSYGVSQTSDLSGSHEGVLKQAIANADEKLLEHKAERERTGERAGRGEKPKGYVEKAAKDQADLEVNIKGARQLLDSGENLGDYDLNQETHEWEHKPGGPKTVVKKPEVIIPKDKAEQSKRFEELDKIRRKIDSFDDKGSNIRKGEVGMMLETGEVVSTFSGRETTPFPKFGTKTGKITQAHLTATGNWLLENAALEAESRGDKFNALQFRNEIGYKTIPQAAKDSAEEYLFGYQPEIPKSFLKPLAPKGEAQETPVPEVKKQEPPASKPLPKSRDEQHKRFAELDTARRKIDSFDDKGNNPAFAQYKQEWAALGKQLFGSGSGRFSRTENTIDVDGVDRPTTNSNGQPIAGSEEAIRNFWRGFGNSKVVDAEGRPLVVYRGLDSAYEEGERPDIEWVTPDPEYANQYADNFDEEAENNVLKLYANIANPLDLGFRDSTTEVKVSEVISRVKSSIMEGYGDKTIPEDKARAAVEALNKLRIVDHHDAVWQIIADNYGITQAAKLAGFDGYASNENTQGKSKTYAAFDRKSLKSAIGNNGEFNPENPNITKSISENQGQAKNPFTSTQEAIQHLVDNFGEGINRLVKAGILNVTNSKQEWPESIQHQLQGNEEAVYLPKERKIYTDLSSIEQDRLIPVMLHELGEHFNLKAMLGIKGYEALQQQITARAKISGSPAAKIWAQVKRLYPDLKVGDEEFVAEVIAKLGEVGNNQPWYRRLLIQVKAFLMKHGLARGVVAGSITEADLGVLLASSLRSAAKGLGREPSFFRPQSLVMASIPSTNTPRFYSALRNAFAKAPNQVFTSGEQIKNWINGNASKFDVKKGEIYWSGLTDWLDTQEGKVSREAVSSFLENNGVRVKDVTLEDEGANTYREIELDKQQNAAAKTFFDVVRNMDLPMAIKGNEYFDDNLYYALEDGDLAVKDLPESLHPLAQDWLDKKEELRNFVRTENPPTKHGDGNLVLPGGRDYKELVITVPTTESFKKTDSTHFGDVGAGKQIAWLRLNTRDSSEGKKVLFLEEVQSQRGQEGRKKGFMPQFTPVEKARLEAEYEKLEAESIALHKQLKEDIDNDEHFERIQTLRKYVRARMSEIDDKLNPKYDEKVPPAPFVTDANNKATNAYISLLLKKAISEAVDNDHTVVAWTTGDQQADRYDLGNFVDKITTDERNAETGLRRVDIDMQNGGKVLYWVNDGGRIEKASDGREHIGKYLSDLIGKDVSDKILSNPDDHELSGDGLRIGGGWTQAMYGNAHGLNQQGKPSLVQQAAAEIARKMGGKVGRTILKTTTGHTYPRILSVKGTGALDDKGNFTNFTVVDEFGEQVGPIFDDYWKADDFKGDVARTESMGHTEQPALIITDQMRDKVLSEGMPMFSRPAESEEEAPEEVKTWRDGIHKSWTRMKGNLANQKLAFLSTSEIVEISKDIVKNAVDFKRATTARSALVSMKDRDADRIVKEWRSLPPVFKRLTDKTMQDSTLNDVDASKAWNGVEEGDFTLPHSYNPQAPRSAPFRAYTQAKFPGALAAEIKARAPSALHTTINSAYFNTRAEAEAFVQNFATLERQQTGVNLQENTSRQEAHKEVAEKYARLPEKGKKVYAEAHQFLQTIFDEKLQAIENRIDETILDKKKAAQMIAELRQQFESNSMQWYYAPLSRFGKYWLYSVDQNNVPNYQMFESDDERNKAKTALETAGHRVSFGKGLQGLQDAKLGGANDTFVLQVNNLIGNAKLDKAVSDELQDEIYQMYLSSLPDVSMRHRSQHRKGTAGFEKDQVRSFAHTAHHSASQLSNMIHGREMGEQLRIAVEVKDLVEMPDRKSKIEQEVQAANDLMQRGITPDTEAELTVELADEDMQEAAQQQLALLEKFKSVDGNGDLDKENTYASLDHFRQKQENLLRLATGVPREASTKIADVIDELTKTYNFLMNPGSSDMDAIAGTVRQLGFIFNLGFSISSGLLNTLQTPGVAVPVVAGEHGYGKAIAAFNRTTNEFGRAVLNMYHKNEAGEYDSRDEDGNASITVELKKRLEKVKDIPGPERDALQNEIEFLQGRKDDSTIAKTQTMDVIGIGKEGSDYGGTMHDFAAKMGWMFHHGERMNREITLLAAFRLGMEKYHDTDKATEYAIWANERAHFNYDPADAARIFRGWPSQIALQFKKYPRAMMYLWAKSASDAIKGWTADTSNAQAKELGKQAAATLGGLAFMQVAFAGAFGLPMMGVITGMLNILGDAFGDDDEPYDIQKEARLKLTEWGGEDFATAVVKGAFNLTPVNLSSRMSLSDPFLHPPEAGLEGKDLAMHYIGEMAGPGGGILTRLLVAFQRLGEGEIFRAAEQALPKAVADLVKSARYATEDAQTLHGELIKEMTPEEIFMQMLGFSSSDLEVKQTFKGYAKNEEKVLSEKRQRLINAFVRAKEHGDELPREEIKEWNVKHPEWKIMPANLQASVKSRKKKGKEIQEFGFSVNPKLKYLHTKYGTE